MKIDWKQNNKREITEKHARINPAGSQFKEQILIMTILYSHFILK